MDATVITNKHDSGSKDMNFTNIWVRTENNGESEFWHIDYKSGCATKSQEKPRFESVKKLSCTVKQFLLKKDFKIQEENENMIKFG